MAPPADAGAAAGAPYVDLERRLSARAGADVGQVRVVVPDAARFVEGVVALLADEGYGLVCAAGAEAEAAVLAVADEHPATRFCVVPATPREVPDNVLLVVPRIEEPAFLAGAAAAMLDPERPPGLVGGPGAFALDRQRAAFQAGVDAVSPTPRPAPAAVPVADADTAVRVAGDQYAAEIRSIYVATSAETAAGVLRAAVAAEGAVLGPAAVLTAEGELHDHVLVAFREDPVPALALAIERTVGTWSGGVATIGLADGAFELVAGPAPRAEAILRRVRPFEDDIVAGRLTPPA